MQVGRRKPLLSKSTSGCSIIALLLSAEGVERKSSGSGTHTLKGWNDIVGIELTIQLFKIWRAPMKWMIAAACAAAVALASVQGAEAKGCIKGAIVGGVAGHMAGHGKIGAAAGCAIGHHEANKADASKSTAQVPSDQK